MKDTKSPLTLEDIKRDLGPTIYGFLKRYVGNPETAEDLLQETLFRIHKGLSSFGGRSSTKTWALAIAKRVAADYLRHSMHKVKIVELYKARDPVDSDRSLEEGLVIDEMNDCLRTVIDSLPDSYRSALLLHDFAGLTAKQTAEVCDCSLATAKIRIHRARNRLKSALSGQCDFYRDQENIFRCENKDK